MRHILLGSDHAGYELKEYLKGELEILNWTVQDFGAHSHDSCDYPLIAHALCGKVVETRFPGILICGTGIGMSIAANRHPDIRAALCGDEFQARMSRRHNNANVLCLGARVTGVGLALSITAAFLESSFEGGRHQRRLDQLNLPS